jgi:formylglycine-generating enzyme required for sulfatase activity/serine/threonine protein kinase
MPRATDCPDLAAYKKLATGELLSPQLEAVLEHLERCEACASCVEALPENDTLVNLIRQTRTLCGRPGSDMVAGLVKRLSKLRAPEDRPAQTNAYVPEPSRAASSPVAAASKYSFLAPPEAADELGRMGLYRVLQVLGKGGMGIVFRAEDPQLNRMVALKVMLPEMADAESGRERFLREARAMAAIKHDHIVSIYQVGEDRGVPFLAMEFLEGETLESRLRRDGKLPLTEVLRIGSQIAGALAEAHHRGLIHRDIKPSNLWLEDLGERAVPTDRVRLKMLDFGLARAIQGPPALTQQGMIVGSPEYMAPEQVEGKALDHRCDLFSLGCVLYRMSTGESPFQRADLISTLRAVVGKDPIAPHELEPNVPPALSKLIQELLAKDPAKRPESAQAVAEALARMAVAVQPFVPSTEAVDSPPRHSDSTTQPTQALKSPTNIKRRWLIGAGVAACGLLAFTLLWAGGVIRVKTTEGIVVIYVNEPNPDVYVDGEMITVTWDNGGRIAQVRIMPGTHQIEVKKDGFTVQGKELTLKDGAHEILTARLEPVALPPTPHDRVEWTTLIPQEVQSAGGTTLTKLPDASILASGENPSQERYIVTATTPLQGITAIGLELLTHPSLLSRGPGRGPHGGFVLNELTVRVSPANDPRRSKSVVFERALAASSPAAGAIENAIDGTIATAWGVLGQRGGQELNGNQVAAFVLREPVSFPNGATFTFVLDQLLSPSYPHNIGRFRLSVTTSKLPITVAALPKPPDVPAVIRLPVIRAQKSLIVDPAGMKLELVLVPAGEFMMGAPDAEPGSLPEEKPQHRVKISNNFYMGKYPVTQEQFKKIMGWNPSFFSAGVFPAGEGRTQVAGMDTSRFPVENASWEDAQEFCEELSIHTGLVIGLPTEAQWEYTCRAGTTTPFHFGTQANGTEENCNGNHPYGTQEKGPYLGRPCPVGFYRPNPWGLYDMGGNIHQWCADYWGERYYHESPTVDPKGPPIGTPLYRDSTKTWHMDVRILRGGSWHSGPCRAAARSRWMQRVRNNQYGFRVICVE